MKALISVVALVVSMAAFSTEASASSCTVLMKNQRGHTVDTFNSRAYDRRSACQQAKRQCERSIWNGNRRHSSRLRCQVAQRGGNYGRQVTKKCSTSLIGKRGRTIQYFQAKAKGQARTGVKAKACRKALRKCNQFKSSNGYYRARCISTESNPPVNPPRRGARGNGRGGRH